MMNSWIPSLVWVVAILAVDSSFTPFPKHRQEEKSGENVTLTCHTDFEGTIFWSHSEEGDLSETGRQLVLPDFDVSMTGNYFCQDGNRHLDEVYVFLADTSDSTTPELKCWAENYNCTFQCAWADPNYPAVRLRNERDNGSWVTPSPEGVFNLSHSTYPGAEEVMPLEVTLEAHNQDWFLRINKTFYLRDIIQPSAPKVEWSVSEEGDVLEVDVQPADSWPTPASFFPLEYQIEYRNKDNGKEVQQLLCCKEEEKECWNNVKCQVRIRVTKFRVRSRDPLVKSNWGHWTSWENVRKKRTKNGKNGGKRRSSGGEKRKKKREKTKGKKMD